MEAGLQMFGGLQLFGSSAFPVAQFIQQLFQQGVDLFRSSS